MTGTSLNLGTLLGMDSRPSSRDSRPLSRDSQRRRTRRISRLQSDYGKNALYAFGWNEHGRLGTGEYSSAEKAVRYKPARVQLPGKKSDPFAGQPVKQVVCGTSHTLYLLGNGDIFACGNDANGQLGANGRGGRQITPINIFDRCRRREPYLTFERPLSPSPVHESKSAGSEHELSTAEAHNEGQEVFAESAEMPSAVNESGGAIACIRKNEIAVEKSPFGNNVSRRDVQRCHPATFGFAMVTLPAYTCVQSMVDVNTDEMLAQVNKKSPIFTGYSSAADLSDVEKAEAAAGELHIVQIEAALHSSFAVTEAGRVLSWGWNRDGQLGLGHNQMLPPRPCLAIALPSWRHFVELAAGDGHVLARARDGSVYSWGYDSHGQLGQGGTWNGAGERRRGSDLEDVLRSQVSRFQPARIRGFGPETFSASDPDTVWHGPPAVRVAAGAFHSFVVAADARSSRPSLLNTVTHI